MHENMDDWGQVADALDARTAPAPDDTLATDETRSAIERRIELDAADERSLRPVLDAIRDLRDSLVSYQSLEHTMVELCQSSEFHQAGHSQHLVEIRDELQALREIVEASHHASPHPRTGDASSKTQALQFWRVGSDELHRQQRAGILTIALLTGTAALLAWSIYGYVQSGSVWLGVLALVILNAIGIAAVRRTRS